MVKFRSGNHEIWARVRRGEDILSITPDRRGLVFAAVREQILSDGKALFDPSQKFNESPYRYGRDELQGSIISISELLAGGDYPIRFGVKQDFKHPTIASFTTFVNTQFSQSVSSLITGIMDASRWA